MKFYVPATDLPVEDSIRILHPDGLLYSLRHPERAPIKLVPGTPKVQDFGLSFNPEYVGTAYVARFTKNLPTPTLEWRGSNTFLLRIPT